MSPGIVTSGRTVLKRFMLQRDRFSHERVRAERWCQLFELNDKGCWYVDLNTVDETGRPSTPYRQRYKDETLLAPRGDRAWSAYGVYIRAGNIECPTSTFAQPQKLDKLDLPREKSKSLLLTSGTRCDYSPCSVICAHSCGTMDEPLSKTYRPYFTPKEISALSARQRGKQSTARDEKHRQIACGFIEAVGSRAGL